eukprot:jgi/Mesvir1/21067/Mv25087-RA.3
MQARWSRDSLDAGLGDTLGRILRDKGPFGLFAGVRGAMTGAAAAVAARMLVYDSVLAHQAVLLPPGAPPGMVHLLAGAVGELCGVLVRAPSELVKQRLQVGRMQGSAGAAVWHILTTEGPPGLYRGAGAMMLRDVPQTALNFAVYEAIKRSRALDRAARWVRRQTTSTRNTTPETPRSLSNISKANNCTAARVTSGEAVASMGTLMGGGDANTREGVAQGDRRALSVGAGKGGRDYDDDVDDDVSGGRVPAWQSLVAGGLSGAVSAFLTTPFDVIKTKVMTAGASSASVGAVTNAAATHSAMIGASAGTAGASAGLSAGVAAGHGGAAAASNAAAAAAAARGAAGSVVQGTGRRMLRRGGSAAMVNIAVGLGGEAAGTAAATAAGQVGARVGMVDAARRIMAEQGLRGFFAGAVPRTLLMVPDVATMMLVYELTSRVIEQIPPLELRMPRSVLGPRRARVPDREWKG